MGKSNRDQDAVLGIEVRQNRIHTLVVRGLLMLLTVEWLFLLLEKRWLSAFLVLLIITTLLSPLLFRAKMDLDIPAEFHLAAVVFVLAALYLGEIQGFYQWLWWWDIALHTTAGFLMGIFGFLLVYILNESRQVDIHMTPGFIAFFSFIFAVAVGTFWEFFEFGMDQWFGTNMQKPMFNDPSGLTDTMWDMIVNSVGAMAISTSGWWYLKSKEHFFVKSWIRKFIAKNPGRFTLDKEQGRQE